MAESKHGKDSSMKGCSDGHNCPKRNTCKRYKMRDTFAEQMAFYVMFQPDCNFYIKGGAK